MMEESKKGRERENYDIPGTHEGEDGRKESVRVTHRLCLVTETPGIYIGELEGSCPISPHSPPLPSPPPSPRTHLRRRSTWRW